MHELSLVHALFDEAERAIAPRPARCVSQLTVQIGELAGVDADLFRAAFDACRAERGFEGAGLAVILQKARWRCRDGHDALLGGAPLQCPSCGAPATLSAGGELVLLRVELEVTDV